MRTIHVVDSHTGGEPTRVVVTGGPDLGGGTVAERARVFTVRHDAFRSCVANEPRGSDILVGALLVPPVDPASACGVIFFNNVGVLGMCGHGTIGLAVTLQYLGRIGPGTHRVETPVGDIAMTLADDGRVSVRNVPSYRSATDVAVDVPGLGRVIGDIAWGGNWFFLVDDHGEELHVRNVKRLTDRTERIRQSLQRGGITGADGAEIDHIELFGPPGDSANDAVSHVVCHAEIGLPVSAWTSSARTTRRTSFGWRRAAVFASTAASRACSESTPSRAASASRVARKPSSAGGPGNNPCNSAFR